MESPERSDRSPLPWNRLAVLLPAFAADALAVTMPSPFLPFMVQSLLQFPPEQQYKIGYYAGLLGGSYECGQILSSPLWGALADRWGRRPIMLVCLFLGSCFMLAFGFSTCFWMALTLRFGLGLANGAMLVGRTYMADITDATNETAAFALIGIVWGSGDVVGPIVGGLLSDPRQQYPAWYAAQSVQWQAFLSTYPFALPCIVVSAVGFADFALAFCALPETRKPGAQVNDSGEEQKVTLGAAWRLFKNYPALRSVCAISLFFGLTIGANDPTITVWARGQLGVTPEYLGAVQSATGVISIAASFLVITQLVKVCGVCDAMCISLVIVALGYACPAVDIAFSLQAQSWATLTFLSATYGTKALGCESCFTGLTLLLKRYTPSTSFGTVQGIGNAFLSCGLALGPLWGPPLFAISTRIGGLAAGAVPFVVLVALTAVAAVLSHALPAVPGAGSAGGTDAGLQKPMLVGDAAS